MLKKLLLLCSLTICATAFAAPTGYHVVAKIQVGGEGGWDLLAVDSQARRLYLSHSTHVAVVDIATNKVVGDISDTPGVHAIAVAPELGRGFTTNGRSNTSTIFDLKTLKIIGQVKTGTNPDAIIYDPATKRVFTFSGGSQDATAFDAATGEVLGTIAVGGKPELPAADGRGRLYVNVEDTSEVIEIDARDLVIRRRFSLKPGEEPTGIGIDIRHHRVFSACANKLMTVLDTRTGEIIATVPIGEGPDGAGYDPGAKLAFSSNGAAGTVTVVREVSPGKFEVAQTVQTQRGARTMALDETTHRLYLPTAQFGPTPAATAATPRPRPAIIKDSFMVLVVGM